MGPFEGHLRQFKVLGGYFGVFWGYFGVFLGYGAFGVPAVLIAQDAAFGVILGPF